MSKLSLRRRVRSLSLRFAKKQCNSARNTELHSISKVANIGRKITGLKLDWAGHVYRLEPNQWAKVVEHCVKDGMTILTPSHRLAQISFGQREVAC